MVRHFTIFFKLSNIRKHKGESANILENGLCDKFCPSDSSVSKIMAFAKAHRTEKTKNAGSVEVVIN